MWISIGKTGKVQLSHFARHLLRLVCASEWGTSCTRGMAASRTPCKQSRARTSLSDLEELMLKEAAWTAKFIRRQREEEAEAGRGEKQALNWLLKRAPRTFRSSSCRGDKANIPSFDSFTAVEAAAPLHAGACSATPALELGEAG